MEGMTLASAFTVWETVPRVAAARNQAGALRTECLEIAG